MRHPLQPDQEQVATGSPAPQLSARLFGEFALRLGDEPLPAIESARARSLLAHLLLHAGVPHARQRLAFLLWPDSTEGQARTNLRNLLHTLRRTSSEIEFILDITPRTLQLRRDVSCRTDVTDFIAALDEADASETGSDQMVAALQAAVDAYAGDLLEGCYDEWLIEQRERLRDRYLSALRRLAGARAQRRQYGDAVRLCRELVRGDPLNEDAYRLLMSVHDAAGDRAAAVRVYYECVAMLQRELGVEPSPATRSAYARLTRWEHSSAAVGEPVPGGGVRLVGRDEEWDRLSRCWLEAEAHRSQLAVVTGEAGVGKTRLVEELAAWCRHRGAAVAEARAYPSEGDLGYGTVIAWLRSADVVGHLSGAGPGHAAELVRLLPELGVPERQSAQPADENERRRHLFEAVVGVLTAPNRPTLLVADDAQWSDEQSLQLIHYLLRANPSSPLLVVATVRREELDDNHPLADLVGGLEIIDRTSEIRLDRLTRAATETLARNLAGTDLGQEVVDELFAETEGNPLFIVESIRAGGSSTGGERGGRPTLSPKLQAVINARLRHLSPPARELVGLAASVGRAFTADLLTEVSRVDDDTLVRSLDELWRRGVIREHGRDAYDFSHGKIRDAAYDALSPATRRHNHVLVADALKRLHARDLDAMSGQVAGHYDRGGEVDLAVDWYLRAAREAQRLYATAEAVRLLGRARVLVADLPGETRRRQELAVLSALPAPLVNVESYASEKLDELHRRALQVADGLRVELEPSLLRSLVMSSACRNEFDEAAAAAERLRAAGERAGDEGLLVESEYLLGITAFWGGGFDRARQHFEQVVDAFSPAQRTEHLVRFGQDPAVVCLSRLANTLWFLGHDDAARRTRDDAVAMAVALGHPLTRDTAYSFGFLLSLDLDERDHARHYAAALSPRDDQSLTIQINAVAYAGFVDVLDGRASDGMAHIRRALELAGPVNHAPGYRAALMRVLVAASAVFDDPVLGVEVADEALALDGTRIWEAEIRRTRAEFLAALGAEPAETDRELRRAAEVARQQGALGLQHRVARTRTRLLG